MGTNIRYQVTPGAKLKQTNKNKHYRCYSNTAEAQKHNSKNRTSRERPRPHTSTSQPTASTEKPQLNTQTTGKTEAKEEQRRIGCETDLKTATEKDRHSQNRYFESRQIFGSTHHSYKRQGVGNKRDILQRQEITFTSSTTSLATMTPLLKIILFLAFQITHTTACHIKR
jgi:hypothetical protein